MDTWALALRVTGLGWYVVGCVLVGVLGGLWLDDLAGTKVLFTLLGILFGTVAAFYGLYKMVKPFIYKPPSGKQSSD
ncbi:MAG: hypothetical protein BZY88_04390 [SAR202 cluster bacterium Io17-Chloro-G9]|nr:MAG: hypothetical protein BZY88_04390 [SAR202 cluster bacterium Io17-Chloro-G9]